MKKKILAISFTISFLMLGSIFVSANNLNVIHRNYNIDRDEMWYQINPDSLPIWITKEEQNNLEKIGLNFMPTAPPPEPVRMPAEFDPMQGVLIRYPFGISYQIIAEMSEDVEVVTVVASSSEQSYVYSQYQSHGVNIDNCDFLIAASDSYWTRDYGPWFIFNGDDELGIVDMIYNRPRPNDDLIPTKLANALDMPVYNMNLITAGGNYMTDGHGIAVSTNLVWSENPSMTHEEVDQIMKDYCGIDMYHVVPDALGEYIKHIDCWAKLLTPDTIMIIEPSISHPRYEKFQEAVEYFENQTTCYGTPFNVVRVYTHMSEPYINSLILNDKVLVPTTGSQWDDEAIASYEAALPGYEVLGFYGSWASTDALHCRTKGIVDRGMLYIEHTPLYGIQEAHDGIEITANIIAYSQENIKTSSTGVFWKTDGGTWNFVEMEPLDDDEYHAFIPAQETGTKVYYYIHAEDFSGRSENHPYIGETMAYSFECSLLNEAPEKPRILGPTEGNINQELEFSFKATDPDNDELYYFIDWGDGSLEEWIGPISSGEEIYQKHTWITDANYSIQAKVKDTFGFESEWETFNVNIPRAKFYLRGLSERFSIFSFIIKYFSFLFFQI
jgi:agmatine/peptidylarginine deiminase